MRWCCEIVVRQSTQCTTIGDRLHEQKFKNLAHLIIPPSTTPYASSFFISQPNPSHVAERSPVIGMKWTLINALSIQIQAISFIVVNIDRFCLAWVELPPTSPSQLWPSSWNETTLAGWWLDILFARKYFPFVKICFLLVVWSLAGLMRGQLSRKLGGLGGFLQ